MTLLDSFCLKISYFVPLTFTCELLFFINLVIFFRCFFAGVLRSLIDAVKVGSSVKALCEKGDKLLAQGTEQVQN